jgi:hypothetical protein
MGRGAGGASSAKPAASKANATPMTKDKLEELCALMQDEDSEKKARLAALDGAAKAYSFTCEEFNTLLTAMEVKSERLRAATIIIPKMRGKSTQTILEHFKESKEKAEVQKLLSSQANKAALKFGGSKRDSSEGGRGRGRGRGRGASARGGEKVELTAEQKAAKENDRLEYEKKRQAAEEVRLRKKAEQELEAERKRVLAEEAAAREVEHRRIEEERKQSAAAAAAQLKEKEKLERKEQRRATRMAWEDGHPELASMLMQGILSTEAKRQSEKEHDFEQITDREQDAVIRILRATKQVGFFEQQRLEREAKQQAMKIKETRELISMLESHLDGLLTAGADQFAAGSR